MNLNKNIIILLTVVGLLVFATAFYFGQFVLNIGILPTITIAIVLTIGSDILTAVANDRFNKSPDAKLYQRNELVGETGKVITDFLPQEDFYVGRIEVRNESWNAKTSIDSLKEDDEVYIKDRDGMFLIVDFAYNQRLLD